MRNIRVRGTRHEVVVEVDGVQVVRHPLGKNFEYGVTAKDIEMLTEMEATKVAEEMAAEAEVAVELEVDADAEDADEYADD